jgi:hypothetical protein
MHCPQRAELQERAMEALRRLNKITHEQMETLKANNLARVLEIDKTLESLFGEKERAFGALKQHIEEHGC